MSGHSKWSTIKRKKGKADAERGRLFTKVIKEITVAARAGGGDESANPRLRMAIHEAKAVNMPQINIERAIQRGTGELPGVTYEEVTYEGYGPGGVAIFIEAVTDNRNRTVAEIRHLFGKYGGNLSESGSVAWMFQQKGSILVEKSHVDEEMLMMITLDAGAEDLIADEDDDSYEIVTPPEDLYDVKKVLDEQGISYARVEMTRTAQTIVKLTGKQAEQAIKLLEAIEEHDDVQKVFLNFEVDVEELAALGA
ncbi:MAG: YebC/PmpR family DNA-binding transcriptional regulator [Candidatus Latescibacteria bacterium]|nr:YebC/PmpR family DNA-binding transcriptional regulator [Candidatus Latescibacterota bacterium]